MQLAKSWIRRPDSAIKIQMSIITAKNLNKQFGDRTILKDVSLEISTGELVAIIGPSGCGKSTLLRCLNGLLRADQGQLEIDGNKIDFAGTLSSSSFDKASLRIRKTVGMLFQSFNLFPHLNLLDNVKLAPVVVQGALPANAEQEAKTHLKKVGLSDHHSHYPHQLSGGQQQRGAIARALALRPNVMLYDEPTSALDPSLAEEVFNVMKQLDSEGLTQIVVTHDMKFARDWADRVIFMESGLVIEVGTGEELFRQPKSPLTKDFLRHFL